MPKRYDENARIVHYHFPDEFLPTMLFNQVVAMCINRNEDKREDIIWYVISTQLLNINGISCILIG